VEPNHDYTAQYTDRGHIGLAEPSASIPGDDWDPALHDAKTEPAPYEPARLSIAPPSNRYETLGRLRNKAARDQFWFCLGQGIAIGLRLGVVIVATALLVATHSDSVPAVQAYVPGVALGVLLTWIIYGFYARWLNRLHLQALTILQTTSLPQLIIDGEYTGRVFEQINHLRLIKEIEPRTFEEQLRFAAMYFDYFLPELGGTGTGMAQHIDNWNWGGYMGGAGRFFSVNRSSKDRRHLQYPRLRAICDFFLEE
jgi:hypothetical protein